MGDSRYDAYYARVAQARNRPSAIRSLPDEGVIAALAASALRGDRYTTNVLATEAMNRLQKPRMHRHISSHASEESEHGLREAVSDVDNGDHLCLVYETQEEQFSAAVTYIRAGLERNEQCIYIADENDAGSIADALREQGVDPQPYIDSGALFILTKRDAYLKNGRFDPDWMVNFLAQATHTAEERGYTGLRVTGEMTWALGDDVGGERVLEYENKLNEFMPGRKVTAICQYNRQRFDPDTLLGVVHTHPKVVYGGVMCENFYYVPPQEFVMPVGTREETLDRLLENIRSRAEAEHEILRLNQDLEHLVEERTRELQEALRDLESFSYTVSHDLRAPLRGIDFYAQALEEDYGHTLDGDALSLLSRLRGESQRLSSLVSHLLTLGGVARAEMRPEPLDLTRIAHEVVETLRASEPSRQVRVDVEGGLQCVGDPHLIHMTLQNLLGNAWKFTRRTSEPHVTLRCLEQDGETVFEVRDNGAGFDASKSHKLFSAFSRLHAATDFEGSGIGLATVARVVRRHGGRIWADGRVGEGATFWFTLGPPQAGANSNLQVEETAPQHSAPVPMATRSDQGLGAE